MAPALVPKQATPTLTTGIIWQEYLKGNQCRYFVPCPKCSGLVVLVWSPQFTMLPKTGAEAFILWDKEARRPDGTWDFVRVMKSARAICPHCKHGIEDSYKTKMIRNGVWKPTNANAPESFVSRHLPSLYACSPQTSFGALAVKFLQAKHSLLGLQGFINGELAEPYESQDKSHQRIELVSSKMEITDEWKKLMTVDCQAKSPYFWFVVRGWTIGRTEGIVAGSCNTWEEVRDIQIQHKVVNEAVCVDSGYGARSDADVYKNCARYCEFDDRSGGRALAMGWMPAKGMPGRKKWRDETTGLMVPYYLRGIDPYVGTSEAGSVEMSLFEFSSDFFKDILDAIRDGRGEIKWSVAQAVATEEYWRHLDGEVKTMVFNKITGHTSHIWKRRSNHWPNHLLDCENMQIALANFFGFFTLEHQK